MKKIKFDTRTPTHLRNFMNTMLDIDIILESHTKFLLDQSGKDECDDEDTIFLRSAYMLLCSAWEAFVEDLITNGVSHLIENSDFENLPKPLLKKIAIGVKSDKNDLSPWQLAGDKWKSYLNKYLEGRVQLFNTPKSKNIDGLFVEFFDLKILEYWNWEYEVPGGNTVLFSSENTINWIDGFISDRGAIVHGRAESKPRNSIIFMNIYHRINKVNSLMNNHLSDRLEQITKKRPWENINYNIDWLPYLKAI
jgi:hypothetical protein